MENTHVESTRMETRKQSDNLDALAAALAKAQGAMENARKDSKNPHFGSKYADLAAVWDAARPALSANGLSVVQTVSTVDGGAAVVVCTTLLHASGQFLRECLQLPVAQRTPQAVGSAITYGRRYALAALVGVAQEDDDGAAGSGHQSRPQQRPEREERPVAPESRARPEAARPSAPPAMKAEKAPEAPPAEKPAPKEEVAAAPASAKSSGTAEATQRAARAAALWKSAKSGGMSKDGWRLWLEQVLGTAKPSSELTDDDLSRLEVALPELLSGGRAA